MERELNKPPVELKDKIKQLEKAIEATKRSIKDGTYGFDNPALQEHLAGLERELDKTRREKEEADRKAA